MAAPFRALPPGVYFNPTAEECVRDYIKPWAAGVPPPTDRVICDVDVYSDSPGALLLGREPGFSRGFNHKWLMLSHCGGRGKTAAGRGKRVVATGGSWQSEQTPKGVVGASDGEDGEDEDEQPHGGRRRSFGFYVGKNGRKRGEKTPWIMEEFTALEDGHGGGDGTFVVFCRIYLTPRLEKEDKEKKRQILGDDMVAFDRNGKLKPVRVVVSPELFDAAAQGQVPAPPRVLGFQQAQPARHVLGFQQGQPAAPPLLRFLGHQHGQAAATPAVLGDHHGRAMLPWGVPAHHHGHAAAAPHQRFLGYRQGQAAVQGGPDEYCGTAVQPQLLHVLDPCYNQEASPSVRLVDPQQSKVMTHTEKKLRLAYGSPPPPPQSSDSRPSSCVVHISPSQEQGVVIQIHDDNQCSAEPVATTLPSQEIPGTATAGSAEAEPPCDASAPAPAELADDAGKAGAEPMLDPGIYMNLVEFEPFSEAVPDFLVHGEFNPPYDDDPPPPPGFDEFQLVEFGVVFDDLVK